MSDVALTTTACYGKVEVCKSRKGLDENCLTMLCGVVVVHVSNCESVRPNLI